MGIGEWQKAGIENWRGGIEEKLVGLKEEGRCRIRYMHKMNIDRSCWSAMKGMTDHRLHIRFYGAKVNNVKSSTLGY